MKRGRDAMQNSAPECPRIQGSYSKNPRAKEPKLLADAGEETAPRPPMVKPLQLEISLADTPGQHEDAEAAARTLPRLMEEDEGMLPLFIGIVNPETESVLRRGALKTKTPELGEHLQGARVVSELNEFDRASHGCVHHEGETPVCNQVVDPIVLPARHKLGGLEISLAPNAKRGNNLSASDISLERTETLSEHPLKLLPILQDTDHLFRVRVLERPRKRPRDCHLDLCKLPKGIGGCSMLCHGCSSCFCFL